MVPRDDLQARLTAALDECARLRAESERLRAQLAAVNSSAAATSPTHSYPTPLSPAAYTGALTSQSPPAEKIALFRSLFGGRDDVFAQRWESTNGRSGYSPACRNEWNRPLCQKPKVHCSTCAHREFVPLTDTVFSDHLRGKRTIGIYPLLRDDTCRFVAVDFDKDGWQADVTTCLKACAALGIPAVVERSRSGNGAHVWVFFSEPVPAALARSLGTAALTRTLEQRHEAGLDSYDRLFPNQDTLPKGGFGNLIALPLQHGPRLRGNSLFVDPETFKPWPDQWAFLSRVQRLSLPEVERLVAQAIRSNSILKVPLSRTEDDGPGEDPWASPLDKRCSETPVRGPLPSEVAVVLDNLVYVAKEGLPPAFLSRIVHLAAFQNPEFYKAQAMRLPTFNKPRVICCAEDFPRHVALPRGCLAEVVSLLEKHGIRASMSDQRHAGEPIAVTFQGQLRASQEKAVQAMLAHDTGILSGATAFGKTVVAAKLIAERSVNTLVLVHRTNLLEQWRDRLATFLGMAPEWIGQIGDGKAKPSGMIDVATIQSLYSKGEVRDLVARYGHVVVDECHHVSAFSFEQVMRRVRARYVLGLTATPIRRDGHHPIIVMQCGRIHFRVSAKDQAAADPIERIVVPRRTEFYLPVELTEAPIQDVFTALTQDDLRNRLLVADVMQAIQAGCSPLVLTDRIEHVLYLAAQLTAHVPHVIALQGRLTKAKRRAASAQLADAPAGEARVVVATGGYIGEGFDDPRLDTLFLASPVAFRGTLEQYTGRLHREYEGKRLVRVYDYVDVRVPVLLRMYRKRLKGYKSLGYLVEDTSAEGRDRLQEPPQNGARTLMLSGLGG